MSVCNDTPQTKNDSELNTFFIVATGNPEIDMKKKKKERNNNTRV